MFREELELTRIPLGLGAHGLVVAAYLSVVCRLELESELHKNVGGIGGGFIGKGEVAPCRGGSRHRTASGDLLFDALSGAVALALDDDGIDVVQDAVEDG
jgi:hypothetical protein